MILAAGTLAQAGFTTVTAGLPALAPQIRDAYGLTLGETGVVLAASGIGMLFTLLPWGLLADVYGERVVIAVGLGAAAGALVGAAETTRFPGLVVWLAVAGAFGASVNAASGRVVMGWFGDGQRGLALGIRQTAIPIGGGAAALALPWLAQGGETRRAFLVLAAVSAAAAAIGALLVREPPRGVGVPEAATRPLRDARIWRLAGGSSLYVPAQMALTGFVVLFLHEHRHMSVTSAAAVLAGINVAGIAARIETGRWSDRRRARLAPLRFLGVSMTAGMVVVTVLVDAPLWALVPAFVVAGVLSIAWNGLAFTASADVAGLARSGAALGFQQTALGLAGAAFPPAFAWVVETSSWRTAFALTALGPLLGVLAFRNVPEPMIATADPEQHIDAAAL